MHSDSKSHEDDELLAEENSTSEDEVSETNTDDEVLEQELEIMTLDSSQLPLSTSCSTSTTANITSTTDSIVGHITDTSRLAPPDDGILHLTELNDCDPTNENGSSKCRHEQYGETVFTQEKGKLISRTELLSIFRSIHTGKKHTAGVSTIGLVRYFNFNLI